MDSATVAPSTHLLYLLNHQLATDELAAFTQNTSPVLEVLESARLIVEIEKEVSQSDAQGSEKAQSVLHRWNTRITALAGSKIAAAQATGFELALETSRQSEPLFLQNARAWFAAAVTALSRKTPASLESFLGASELVLFAFEKARYLPEFAREVANAGAVRKFGESLLNYAGTEGFDIQTRVAAVDFLSELIVVSASPLRPLSQHIQNIAVGLLCAWSNDDQLVDASRSAARLLASVYIVAGKAQAGQSWRKTVESVVGSAHLLLNTLASTSVEDSSMLVTIPPLDMPPIAGSSGTNGQSENLQATERRLEALIDVLILMLATPTERPVPVPVASLVKLCRRILGLTIYSPVKERHDTALRTAQIALLPTLHVQSARLLGQLISSLGAHLTNESSIILTMVSFVEGTYPTGSSTRTTLYALASMLVENVPLHPDEAIRPLTKIVQSILRDAAVLVDPEEGRQTITNSESTKGKTGDRKAKRARLFESDQVMSGRRRTTLAEAENISHALSSLHRIILHGAWLFPAQLLNQTLRLLLAFGLSAQFLNAVPCYSQNTLLSEGLAYCPAIRINILRCLLATLQSVSKEAQGFLELALAVFRNGILAPILGEEGSKICSQALGMVDNFLRPVVPPLVVSAALRHATRDLTGGPVFRKETRRSEGEDGDDVDQGTANGMSAQIQGQAFQSTFSTQGLQAPSSRQSSHQQPTPMPFVSSALPIAQDIDMSAFGKRPRIDSEAEVDVTISTRSSTAGPTHKGSSTPALASMPSLMPVSAGIRPPPPTEEVGVEGQPPISTQQAVDDDGEQEPQRYARGGAQAALAEVDWSKQDDSDTSDDDAPMPKIVDSDLEDEA